MTETVKSVLSGETTSARELLGDALGVLALGVTMSVMLWLPAILSA
ncbi:hypothetical protein [Paracoccus jeotgali]|nr:hypothetical protein [Paracoccus jeotgali]